MRYCLSLLLQPTGTIKSELGAKLEVHHVTCHEDPDGEYTNS